MAENTKIEWTDHTFNPWEGCQKVGPGCDHCYAETRNARFAGGQAVNWGPGAPRRMTGASNWNKPLKWNKQAELQNSAWEGFKKTRPDLTDDELIAEGFFKPRRPRVFCASLADVFDNAVDPQWRTDLFSLIQQTPNLDWLLLTKRIGNVCGMLAELAHGSDPDLTLLDMMPLPNVWIGATIVNQAEADRDIPKLLDVPARVRFLSMEPLLGPVDLGAWIEPWDECGNCGASFDFEAGRPDECPGCGKTGCMCTGFGSVLRNDFDDADGRIEVPELPGIDWVICGGESGPGARPMHPDWARSLRDQCEAAGVPFLFKQWGEWKPISNMEEAEHSGLYTPSVIAKPHESQDNLNDIYGRRCTVPTNVLHDDGSTHGITEPMVFRQGTEAMQIFRVGKKAAGRLLDGRTWDGFPAL